MFLILSPSKPINFEPRFILKLPQNSNLYSVKHSQNASKNPKKTRRERERLPPGVSPVDGEERERREVAGRRREKEREREREREIFG